MKKIILFLSILMAGVLLPRCQQSENKTSCNDKTKDVNCVAVNTNKTAQQADTLPNYSKDSIPTDIDEEKLRTVVCKFVGILKQKVSVTTFNDPGRQSLTGYEITINDIYVRLEEHGKEVLVMSTKGVTIIDAEADGLNRKSIDGFILPDGTDSFYVGQSDFAQAKSRGAYYRLLIDCGRSMQGI